MAGLESIALALDFLEQREAKKEADQVNEQPTLIPPPTGEAPIPPRTGFLNAPRRVSSDSVNEEASKPSFSPENDPATSLPRDLNVTEDMSPEAISRMVEELANDSEFEGPPPPPPPPTEVISRVLDCDVLCGRGGETNHHCGNVKYRSLVKRYQPLYIVSKRRDKPLIASKIVRLVRHAGGRFLRKDKNNSWRDVGNTKAREKTSQALREGAPDLRSPQKGGGKEERASPPTVAGGASSSLGVRKQPDFHVGYNAGMGLYAGTGASVVETHPSEVDASYGAPAAKKMRAMPPMVSGASMQGMPSQFWGGPQHAFLHGPPSQYMTVPPPSLPMKPVVSSAQSFAAAVSADDDDSKSVERETSSPKPETESPKPRGPRIKFLKRRLEQEQGN